jgi:predicted lipoprotein with Yx(FWY)xxD motif
VKPALLSSFERSDGIRQVLYAKHALYTYQDDTSPGMVTGQGVETYGGIWWVVAPTGKPDNDGAPPT